MHYALSPLGAAGCKNRRILPPLRAPDTAAPSRSRLRPATCDACGAAVLARPPLPSGSESAPGATPAAPGAAAARASMLAMLPRLGGAARHCCRQSRRSCGSSAASRFLGGGGGDGRAGPMSRQPPGRRRAAEAEAPQRHSDTAPASQPAQPSGQLPPLHLALIIGTSSQSVPHKNQMGPRRRGASCARRSAQSATSAWGSSLRVGQAAQGAGDGLRDSGSVCSGSAREPAGAGAGAGSAARRACRWCHGVGAPGTSGTREWSPPVRPAAPAAWHLHHAGSAGGERRSRR